MKLELPEQTAECFCAKTKLLLMKRHAALDPRPNYHHQTTVKLIQLLALCFCHM